jgi:hypothetical protein
MDSGVSSPSESRRKLILPRKMVMSPGIDAEDPIA